MSAAKSDVVTPAVPLEKNVRRGKANRRRGGDYERELVNALKERGLECRRCALSGALAHEKGDIRVTAGYDGKTVYVGEAKRRRQLPEYIVNALGQNDFAAFRQDRGETLVVLRLSTFADLLQ